MLLVQSNQQSREGLPLLEGQVVHQRVPADADKQPALICIARLGHAQQLVHQSLLSQGNQNSIMHMGHLGDAPQSRKPLALPFPLHQQHPPAAKILLPVLSLNLEPKTGAPLIDLAHELYGCLARDLSER